MQLASLDISEILFCIAAIKMHMALCKFLAINTQVHCMVTLSTCVLILNKNSCCCRVGEPIYNHGLQWSITGVL